MSELLVWDDFVALVSVILTTSISYAPLTSKRLHLSVKQESEGKKSLSSLTCCLA